MSMNSSSSSLSSSSSSCGSSENNDDNTDQQDTVSFFRYWDWRRNSGNNNNNMSIMSQRLTRRSSNNSNNNKSGVMKAANDNTRRDDTCTENIFLLEVTASLGDGGVAVTTVAAALGLIVVTTMMIISRRRRRRQRNRGLAINKEKEKSTNLYYKNKAMMQRKQEFLERIRKNQQQQQQQQQQQKSSEGDSTSLSYYGYKNSPAGYIDNWRHVEFPHLIPPLPTDLIDDEGNDNDNCDSVTETLTPREERDQDHDAEVYLDYAGSGLPTQTQLRNMYQQAGKMFANPHSTGPAASRTLQEIQKSKQLVLQHLNATPGKYAHLTTMAATKTTEQTVEQQQRQQSTGDHLAEASIDSAHHCGYDLVFTSGATEGFRIVATHFPWTKCRRRVSTDQHDSVQKRCDRGLHHPSIFMYAVESHNSVTGMRHAAIDQINNNNVIFHAVEMSKLIQMTAVDFRSLQKQLLAGTEEKDGAMNLSSYNCSTTAAESENCECLSFSLLVFPAECNFSGYRPTNSIISCIIANARVGGWMTMLDIAKAASTGPVEMTTWDPDFASLSFYKIFGEPTGLGALLVKRSSIKVLTWTADGEMPNPQKNDDMNLSRSHNRYQGGGSVDVMVPRRNYTVPKEGLAALTNGTVHFRGITALQHGFDSLYRLGGMANVHNHSTCLAREFVRRLKRLKHHGIASAFEIYGPWGEQNKDEDGNHSDHVGPTVAFNVLRDDGSTVGYNEVSKLGSLYRIPIQFRTGCFCNPGACQQALRMSDEEVIDNFEKSGHKCGDDIDIVNGRPTGAVRVSFGKESLWEDLDLMVQFLEENFVDSTPIVSSVAPSVVSTVVSNLEDDKPTTVSVSELYIFPIKSCSAQRVWRWPVELPSGKLKYDREFALVDTSGSAMRLQNYPKLHSISPAICLTTHTMTVSAPGVQDLVLNLNEDLYQGGENIVQVCGNKCGGRVWGSTHVSDWFSSVLGVQCWLARYSDINRAKSGFRQGTTSQGSRRNGYSNEQPILLISEHAVSVLNQVLIEQNQAPVDAKRFRPNIVVKTNAANKASVDDETGGSMQSYSHPSGHIEDDWTEVSLIRPSNHDNDDHEKSSTCRLKYTVQGGCPRCTMVDYDPATGSKGKTLRALAKYRRHNGRIVFGIFLNLVFPSKSMTRRSDDEDETQDRWISEGDIMECS